MNPLIFLATKTHGAGTPLWKVVTLSQRASAAIDTHPWMALLYMLIALGAVAALVALSGMFLIYAERKIAGHFQARLGPMRVGPHGIFQTVADTLKLLLKEDIAPANADQLLHIIGPFLSIMATILVMMLLPFSPIMQVVDLNIGVLFISAVTGFGVLGILIGGWASNNKWSLIGAMRAGAQIISYELTIALALLVIVLFSGSLSLSDIIKSQAKGWWIWRAHLVGFVTFLLFIIASVAELNRTPFDIPEGESELTGGFNTEYSGLRFAFYFLAEFVNMFISSAIAATLFLGGWMPLHIGQFTAFNAIMDLIPPVIWFVGKTFAVMFIIIWFRWTFPRLRIDQLMKLEWKIMLPMSFINLFVASLLVLSGFYLFP